MVDSNKMVRHIQRMTKRKLLQLFGGNLTLCAKELRVSRNAVYRWPNKLEREQLMRVCYWFLETRGEIPIEWAPKKAWGN